MRKVVAVAVLTLATFGAAAEGAYLRAREVGLRVISEHLSGGFCTPQPVSASSREEVRSALDGVASSVLSDPTGLGPLNLAVIADDAEILQRLRKLGYPLSATAHLLLLDAALHDSRQSLAFLLEFGADPNGKNGYGGTALMVAASNGRLEVARQLLSAGASADIRNNDGGTALHYAIGCKDQAMVSLLTTAGATVDSKASALARKHGLNLAQPER